jgi:flagella basal body P-ring formation protein FlgA
MNRITRLIAVLAALLFGATATAQTTIELHENATVPAGSAVRLDQVAALAGPDAAGLGGVIVLTAEAGRSSATLARESVKAAINTGRPSVSWARTVLRGGDVQITFAAKPAEQPAPSLATTPVPPPAAPEPAPAAAPAAAPIQRGTRTLRDELARTLADTAGVEPATLTLRTDNLAAPDQQLLGQPISPSWKVRIQVLGATPSGRTTVRIDAYDGDRVAAGRTLVVDALVQRDVLVVAAVGGLGREQTIAAPDVRLDSRTVTVSESARLAAVTPEAVIGTVVKRRIEPGKPILPSDVAAPKAAILVKRGDDVAVSCISGGMVIKTKAKALTSARDGETVTLQIEGSKKTFTARMSGPGQAVMSLDPAK